MQSRNYLFFLSLVLQQFGCAARSNKTPSPAGGEGRGFYLLFEKTIQPFLCDYPNPFYFRLKMRPKNQPEYLPNLLQGERINLIKQVVRAERETIK